MSNLDILRSDFHIPVVNSGILSKQFEHLASYIDDFPPNGGSLVVVERIRSQIIDALADVLGPQRRQLV